MEIRSVTEPQPFLPSEHTPAKLYYYLKISDVASQYAYGPWDYPEGSDYPKVSPQTDIYSPNITCGREAFASAATTSTADVLAGSEVGFRVSWDGSGPYGVFWHQGPVQIYLSRAPNDDITTYRGDGDWFKIAYAGPENDKKWLLWPGHGDVCVSLSRPVSII